MKMTTMKMQSKKKGKVGFSHMEEIPAEPKPKEEDDEAEDNDDGEDDEDTIPDPLEKQ